VAGSIRDARHAGNPQAASAVPITVATVIAATRDALRHSDPSPRATSTTRSSPRPDTRIRHGLQQTSQSWMKLPVTSGSTQISTSSPQKGQVTKNWSDMRLS
jgi:hypothetical protein